MYGSGQLKELPTPTTLVAVEVAFTLIPAHTVQLLTVTTTVRVIRTTALDSESHFIKVDLSTA